MKIRFHYFDGCPNWQVTHERLEEAWRDRDDVDVVMERVETSERAAAVDFRTPDGSPTAEQLGAALAP